MAKRKQDTARHPVPPTSEGWKDYLVANGWREAKVDFVTGMSFWSDPLGSDAPAEKRVIKRFKNNRTGNMETLEQSVAPIRPWDYPIHEAVEIQINRDKDAAKAEEESQPGKKVKAPAQPIPMDDDDDLYDEDGE